MANQEVELTGKLKIRHKLALIAIGQFFIWLGNAMQRVNTYEDLNILGQAAEEKVEGIDSEFKEELEEMSSIVERKELQEKN